MIYVGLDLHKRYISACAVAADGRVVAEVRQLSTQWDALAAWLAAFGERLPVVLEATLYCWWLERQLTAAGYEAIVVNAYQVKLIWSTRTKTDPIDAHKLAELARVHLLPALWVPDPRTRALRQALRGRVFLVRQRTVIKNRVHAYLTAENLRCPQVDLSSDVSPTLLYIWRSSPRCSPQRQSRRRCAGVGWTAERSLRWR
jgi:transposase